MAVITISRQYGSGGDEVASRLCEMLGYRYFDKQIMASLASELAFPEGEMVDFCEDDYQSHSLMERLFRQPVQPTPPGTGGLRGAVRVELNEERAVFLTRSAICATHKQGNIVVVGRGGQAVLREKHGVLHVRIEAPLYVRVERVQKEENLSAAAAEARIAKQDKAAAGYLKHFYGVNWADPLLYHLVINAGRIEPETAACLIASAITCLPLFISFNS